MNEDQLIFLVSLPRSGSTMLQKMLGGHSSIFTRSESWLLLPLLSLRSKQIFETKYDHGLAARAVGELMDSSPENLEGRYRKCVSDFALDVYGTYTESCNKKLFLDKTPRYHLVIDQLRTIFPRAKFIVLYRNPLAILSSIVESWLIDDYDELLQFQVDLVEGLHGLSRLNSSSQVMKIKYEELLDSPTEKMKEICRFLELDFEPQLIEYRDQQNEEWTFGDNITVNTVAQPLIDKIDSWETIKLKPRLRSLLIQYLNAIGKDRYDKFGYSFERYHDLLNSSEQSISTPTTICGMRASQFFDFEVEDIASRGYYSAVAIYKRAHWIKMQTEASLKDSLKNQEAQLFKLQAASEEQDKRLAEQNKVLKQITNSLRFRLIMAAMYPLDKFRDLLKK